MLVYCLILWAIKSTTLVNTAEPPSPDFPGCHLQYAKFGGAWEQVYTMSAIQEVWSMIFGLCVETRLDIAFIWKNMHGPTTFIRLFTSYHCIDSKQLYIMLALILAIVQEGEFMQAHHAQEPECALPFLPKVQ